MKFRDVGWRLGAIGAAWLLGVALHLQERSLWPAGVYVGILTAGLAGFALAWRWPRAWALALAGALMIGAGASGWRASLRLADALPTAMEGEDLVLTGVVASLPRIGPAGVQFRFDVEQAHWRDRLVRVPERVSLGWYTDRGNGAVVDPSGELRAGQAWRFTVRLRQPHGSLNPHGFDFERYLFEQGVRATGYVRAAGPVRPQLIEREAGHPIERARQHVRDAIYARVDDARAAGVLSALAIGDQSSIEREDWQIFRATGVAHLMSISGLHVTMFAWVVGLMIDALWRRSARAALLLPAPLAGRWGGLAAAAAYAVFSGWGVPAQRTVWMLATVTLLLLAGRRWPWLLTLLAAAVVVTALDPWALLQPGFWLSFAAVGLLMSSEPAHGRAPATEPIARSAPRRWLGKLRAAATGGLRTQIVATLGLAPLTLVFFQQVSVVGFVANLVAIPLVTLVITPLALLGVAAPPLWGLAAWAEQQLAALLAAMASVPGAVWAAPVAPVWAQAAGLLGAVLAVLPLPWRLRCLALPLVLPLLLPPRDLPGEGRFELLAVDVGQGTSVLIRTRTHLLVYDTGPRYSLESDAGQRVLLPLLQARGERQIDRLVLSHRDTDHVGGADALFDALPVRSLLSSLEDDHPLRQRVSAPVRCEAGQSWSWDGVRFEVIHPRAESYERSLKPNALSCVLSVTGVQGSALLAGDIERRQESALVELQADRLKHDVLLVPHHGSRTSSTAAFLDAVRPGVAVIQAGYRNRFGHPVAEVTDRLRERGALVRQSAHCGAWWWDGNAATLGGLCQRDTARRYWHHAPAPDPEP